MSYLDKTGLTHFFDKLKSVFAPKERGVEYIRGTWTAASGAWTGVTKDSELYDGKQIILYMPFAGSGNATLNLTLAGGGTTGAKNVYFESTTRFTTHKGQNSQLPLVYHKALKLSNGTTYEGWWYLANRDTTVNYQTASMVQISLAEGAWTQETDDYWQSELGLYKKKFAVPSGFSSGSFWIIPLSYGLRDQLLNGHWIVDNGYIWFYGDSNSNTSDISFNALLIKSAGVHGGFNTLNFPGQFGLDLLWENANPTATFGAQTISLSALSKYDGVLVESTSYAQSNENHYLCTDIAFKGRTGAIRLNGTSNAGFRNFTVGEDSIVFKSAYWGGSSANNGNGIPIRIFGFRVNSFR